MSRTRPPQFRVPIPVKPSRALTTQRGARGYTRRAGFTTTLALRREADQEDPTEVSSSPSTED